MVDENPWAGIVDEAKNIRTPKAVLKKQAELLTQQFQPRLRGVLKVRREGDGAVWMDLNVVAPALQNYNVTLVTASHTATLFPCQIESPWVPNSSVAAQTSEELEDLVIALLKTAAIRHVVASAYAQVLG